MKHSEYIPARKSQLEFYKKIELFHKVEGRGFVLYKRSGITLCQMRLHQGKHPETLYIRQNDKLTGLQEAQKGFNRQLVDDVRSGNPEKIKETLVTVVGETFRHPRSGSLEGFADTVDILVGDYSTSTEVLRNLIDLSSTDYSTIIHSINVMAFTLGFASHMGYSRAEAKHLGLSALLHDVGKTRIDQQLLKVPRRLTREEFEEVQSHTLKGYDILRDCAFSQPEIALGALEHHERLDGSGYPIGKTKISRTALIIGLVDCYEALTTDDRPYREAMGPFITLNAILGEEVKAGKFDRRLYCEFVKSLGKMSGHQIYDSPIAMTESLPNPSEGNV